MMRAAHSAATHAQAAAVSASVRRLSRRRDLSGNLREVYDERAGRPSPALPAHARGVPQRAVVVAAALPPNLSGNCLTIPSESASDMWRM